jgi:cytoskeleton protein RodZ
LERFGARLKKIREQRGITLDQVSLSTKIGVRFLRALEDEHFEQLPGGIFNKGFVRSYARMIGTDEEQAIADYLAASEERQPKPPPEIAAASLVQRGGVAAPGNGLSLGGLPLRSLTIALVIVVALLILVFLGIHLRPFNLKGGGGVSGKGKTTAAGLASEQAKSGIAANGQVSGAAQLRAVASTPFAIVVKIKAKDDSWLSITADGKPVMEDTLAAEEEKSVGAQKEIVVKAGNVGGVDFWFNGNKLSSQGEYGNVKTLSFDRNGLRPADRKRRASGE